MEFTQVGEHLFAQNAVTQRFVVQMKLQFPNRIASLGLRQLVGEQNDVELILVEQTAAYALESDTGDQIATLENIGTHEFGILHFEESYILIQLKKLGRAQQLTTFGLVNECSIQVEVYGGEGDHQTHRLLIVNAGLTLDAFYVLNYEYV